MGRCRNHKQTFLSVSGKPLTGPGPAGGAHGIDHIARFPCGTNGSSGSGRFIPLIAQETGRGGIKELGPTLSRLILSSVFIAGQLAPRGRQES